MPLKERLTEDMKDAMRARDKGRLAVLRMTIAAIKQREIDDRIELDEAQTLAIVEKMIKQRQESARLYRQGERDDLAETEESEARLLADYLPEQMGEDELLALIERAIEKAQATSMKDMGAVMGHIKAEAQGRANMAEISARVRNRLAG
jgi:uncharacterized protein YqeY